MTEEELHSMIERKFVKISLLSIMLKDCGLLDPKTSTELSDRHRALYHEWNQNTWPQCRGVMNWRVWEGIRSFSLMVKSNKLEETDND